MPGEASNGFSTEWTPRSLRVAPASIAAGY
jgi:hypothetical protein